ncbi:hypothetical protein CEXT_402061 [Caerostris extrusa]|uniref:Uncharacterized protein n=1 Tax=Caerostris extrusa TaxID=172846 RepID=A0AAV4W6R4_CAEEX|nr:hypothetical protein CEXT_402061 [Caerostris extrusa]
MMCFTNLVTDSPVLGKEYQASDSSTHLSIKVLHSSDIQQLQFNVSIRSQDVMNEQEIAIGETCRTVAKMRGE